MKKESRVREGEKEGRRGNIKIRKGDIDKY
jgi:hypothetical protein